MRLNTEIRQMYALDVKDVVEVHIQAFQGFFLTFLGPNFLHELYSNVLLDHSGIAYVYDQDDSILGFVVGMSEPSGFYNRLLRKKWWRFGITALPATIKSPKIIPRLLRVFTMPDNFQSKLGTSTLISIAVSLDAQRKGIGEQLVLSFLQESMNRNLNWVNLTTDKHNNNGVNAFYRALGFNVVCSYKTPEGRDMNKYEICILPQEDLDNDIKRK